ncbi:MAG: hypothetical protein K8R89_01880 [Anaerolineae bacterium]|nr:hypothetical protein [Anaerolineae bacterium]
MMQQAKWVWLIAVIVLVGVRCSGEAVPTGVVAPQGEKGGVELLGTVSTPSSAENVIPVIGFEGPVTARVGERTLLAVKIWGADPIDELTLEIRISVDYLQVNTPAGLFNQVLPSDDFPASAEIKRNEVDAEGILHYHVIGLGGSMVPTGILLIIPLVPLLAGIGMVEPLAARVTAVNGNPMPVQMVSAWLLEIQDGSAAVMPTPASAFHVAPLLATAGDIGVATSSRPSTLSVRTMAAVICYPNAGQGRRRKPSA